MMFLICIFLFQMLPQFPLPTHDVVMRGNVPVEFEVRLYISNFQLSSKFSYVVINNAEKHSSL